MDTTTAKNGATFFRREILDWIALALLACEALTFMANLAISIRSAL